MSSSGADDLVLVASNHDHDQTPPPSIPLLLPNSQPRDLLHPRGQSINSRGRGFNNPSDPELAALYCSNPDYNCQDVAADCPSPSPLRGSPRSTADSPSFKNKKWKTQMCRNGSACRYGSGCHYAHSKDELQKSTLHQLMQDHADANDEYPYLARPCIFHIMYGEW